VIELQAIRKNKINLSDYDYQDDVKIRLLFATFTEIDLEVLEEILYNSIQFSLDQLLQNLSYREQEITPSLIKLEAAGLFERTAHLIIVNKDKRKYFELQLERFDENFEPGMDLLQNLLKRVPIQVLPNWYHIPRHSNNIFESLIEKYLTTPAIFQRHLLELSSSGDLLWQIASDVFGSPDFEVLSQTIREKYSLSEADFEEIVLLLEFNFTCCLSYRKDGNRWQEIVTPFHEWKQYLKFLQNAAPKEYPHQVVTALRPNEYGFSKDLAEILMLIDREPSHFSLKGNKWELDPKIASLLITNFPHDHKSLKLPSFSTYIDRLIEKIVLLGFVQKQSSQILLTETAFEWLELGKQEQAIAIFKHPFHQVRLTQTLAEIHSDRNIHEVENSLTVITQFGWVLFDDFIKGTAIALKEEKKVRLKKEGRKWRYSIPTYSEVERSYIEIVIFHYLFESGIVSLGLINGEIGFRVTELGSSLFKVSV
jgi:predicted transcriptional regulator